MTDATAHKSIELLAPAGGMRALFAVLRAGADAVYLSGKRFGMRGHRASFHFDDSAMRQAVREVHAAGARIYVTVNNLLCDQELTDAVAYIRFLEDLGVDAVILQDLGLLKELRASPPGLEIHVSTMMNVHSSPFAALLKALGVTRVITSRDITLSQVKEMAARSGMQMEYFVHGDMCSVQSGLCHLSGVLFGQSSNRGRCLKPCRWPYSLVREDRKSPEGAITDAMKYLLARKDMCLYHALPDLFESGIVSLKIEGRMRPAEFLEELVGIYRRAMDRYFENPFDYRENAADVKRLFALRTREFTTSHAFGVPGPDSIDPTGRREPRFFSTPLPEDGLDVSGTNPDPLPAELPPEPPALCAAITDPAVLEAVIAEKPDWIYLAPYFQNPGGDLTGETLSRAVERCRAAAIQCAVLLPPVTPDKELDHLLAFMRSVEPAPHAWMAGNAGQLPVLRERESGTLMADALLNVYNRSALDLLAEHGVVRASISPEISLDHLFSMKRPFPLEIEFSVHGPVQAMFTEDCLLRLALDRNFNSGSCRRFCDQGAFALKNEAGECYPIVTTGRCRNALYFPRHLCMLHRLGPVLSSGAGSLRLNLMGYAPESAAGVVRIYKTSLQRIFAADRTWFRQGDLKTLEAFSGKGLFEAGTEHGVIPPMQNPVHAEES